MVFSLNGQVAFPRARFKDALRQRDAGRYAVFALLMDSRLAIVLDIEFAGVQLTDFGFASLQVFDS